MWFKCNHFLLHLSSEYYWSMYKYHFTWSAIFMRFSFRWILSVSPDFREWKFAVCSMEECSPFNSKSVRTWWQIISFNHLKHMLFTIFHTGKTSVVWSNCGKICVVLKDQYQQRHKRESILIYGVSWHTLVFLF